MKINFSSFIKTSSLLLLVFLFSRIQAQVTIWSENFTGYPNCTSTGGNNNTANPAADWTTTYTDCDDAVTCTVNQSFWGTFNGEFRVNDIEGGPCTCGTGGTTENYITTESIDISTFYNVSISMSVRYTGVLEAGPLNTCDNSSDIVRVTYSIDGGPFTQVANNGFLTGSFGPNPSIPSQTCLNGNSLIIKIQAGDKANDENFFIDNMLVEGFNTPQVANAGPDDTICPGGSVALNATGGGTYTWNATPSLSCTNCANPLATPAATESFIVTVANGGCSDKDTVTVFVQNIPVIVDLGNDTTVCGGPVSFTLDATQSNSSTYLWQDASTDSTYHVTAPGTYYVTVTNSCGSGGDTVVVQLLPVPSVNLGNDTLVCPGPLMIQLDASQTGSSYLWQDGSTDSTYNVTTAGTYYVTLSNTCGTATDTLHVIQLPPAVANLGNDTLVCSANVAFVLNVAQLGATYLWQDGSSNATYNVTAPGTYYVTVTNVCGSASDTMVVQQSGIPAVNLGPDQVICTGSQFMLDATSPFAATYLWQDGSTTPTFVATTPGLYHVTVTTSCNTDADSINLFQQMQLADILDQFSGLCDQDSIMISLQDTYPGASFLWSNGDTSSFSNFDTSGTYYVTISFCGSSLTDTFEVNLKNTGQDLLFVPNAFTPNGDGINDVYEIGGMFNNTLSFSAAIFDRWGILVLSTKEHTFKWDGSYKNQPAAEGVYYLTIEMDKQCEDEKTVHTGTFITLFR